jgi:hypothetical protein
MPKTSINYSSIIIYKLVHNEDLNNDNIYIGSTTNFIKRKCKHKYSCNTEYDKSYKQTKYQYIRDNGGWDNWSMIEIEKYPCNDNNEARAREEYWRSNLKSGLNSVKAYVAPEDIKQNKAEISQRYRENHKDTIIYDKEYNKQYKQEHDEKIKEYAKQYKINNADKINQYLKDYRKRKKEEANAKLLQT